MAIQAEAGLTLLSGTLFVQALGQSVWSVDTPSVGFTAINPIPTQQRYLKAGAGLTVYPFKLTRAFRLENLGFGLQAFLTPYRTQHDRFAGSLLRDRLSRQFP